MTDTLSACIEGEVDVSTLATFDLEYMFLKVRAKSVGETSDVLVRCKDTECGHNNEVTIDLEDVKVGLNDDDNIIDITDSIKVEMRYPTYKTIISSELADETVTLNGTTPVTLTKQYIRMFRGIILTAGSNETNVGNVTVEDSDNGQVAIYIAADDGQTQQAIYTIPAGYRGWFIKGYVGISDSAKTTIQGVGFKWKARANNGTNGAWATKGQIENITYGSSWFQYEYGIPAGPLPGKTDIRMECFSVTDTFGVVGGFDILLVQEGFE